MRCCRVTNFERSDTSVMLYNRRLHLIRPFGAPSPQGEGFGRYPARVASPLTEQPPVFGFPLRGSWREATDEVAQGHDF